MPNLRGMILLIVGMVVVGVLIGGAFRVGAEGYAQDHAVVRTPQMPTASSVEPPHLQGVVATMRVHPQPSHALRNHLHIITEGHGRYSVYVFWDPNCIYCHLFYTKLRTDPSAWKQLTIHWVPVGVIKPTSMAKAATVLLGGLPALEKDERHFATASESGGVAPSTNATAIAWARHNTAALVALMARRGQSMVATPTLWYPLGHWLRMGVPPTISGWLAMLKQARASTENAGHTS